MEDLFSQDGLLQYLMSFLASSEPAEQLQIYYCVEQTDYLRERLSRTGGFDGLIHDFQAYAVPVAVELKEWSSFVACVVRLLCLKQFPESIMRTDVLAQLAVGYPKALLQDLVAQVADPFQRVWAKALLLEAEAAVRDQALVQSLKNELDGLAPPRQQAQISWLVDAYVRLIDQPEFETRVMQVAVPSEWAEAGRRLDHVRIQTLLRRGEPAALDRVDLRQETVWSALFPTLIDLAPEPLRHAWPRLAAGSSTDDLWRLLSARMAADPESSLALAAGLDPPRDLATLRLLEPGLADMPQDLLRKVAHAMTDPVVRAAWWICAWRAAPEQTRLQEAVRALKTLPDQLETAVWCLRLCAHPRAHEQGEARALFQAALRWMVFVQFDVPGPVLADFMDAVATFLPDQVPRRIKSIAASPTIDPGRFQDMLARCRVCRPAETVAREPEWFALMTAPSAVEAFTLRLKLSAWAVPRLQENQRKVLDATLERVLPEERDAFLEDVMHHLDLPDQQPLGAHLLGLMHHPGRRLTAELQLTGGRHPVLDAGRIYEAFAEVDWAVWEINLLADLARPPEEAEARILGYTLGIRRGVDLARALVAHAHHALAYQHAYLSPPLRDVKAALRHLEPALLVPEKVGCAIVPELVALALAARDPHAVGEMRAGVLYAFEASGLSEASRLNVFESLMSLAVQAQRVLGDDACLGLFRFCLRLPDHEGLGAVVRPMWHRLFHVLAAAAHVASARLGKRLCAEARRAEHRWSWMTAAQSAETAPWWTPEASVSPESDGPYYRAVAWDPAGLAALCRGKPDAGQTALADRLLRYWDRDGGLSIHLPVDWKAASVWHLQSPKWTDDLCRAVCEAGFDPFAAGHWRLLGHLITLPHAATMDRLTDWLCRMLTKGGIGKAKALLRLWLQVYLGTAPGALDPALVARAEQLAPRVGATGRLPSADPGEVSQ